MLTNGITKRIMRAGQEKATLIKKMQRKEKPHMIRFVSLSNMNCKLWKLSQQLKSAAICDAINDMETSRCAGEKRA